MFVTLAGVANISIELVRGVGQLVSIVANHLSMFSSVFLFAAVQQRSAEFEYLPQVGESSKLCWCK